METTHSRIVNHPEIFVGERFYKMIQDAKSIKLFMNCRLINVNMDTHNSKAIKSLDLLCGPRTLDGGLKQPVKRTVEAAVYIDASYDGTSWLAHARSTTSLEEKLRKHIMKH